MFTEHYKKIIAFKDAFDDHVIVKMDPYKPAECLLKATKTQKHTHTHTHTKM
jgi:hypothetical protein